MDVFKALEEISKGNSDALRFMRAFYIWVQVQDDLFDKDRPVTAANLVSTNLNLLFEVSQNPFFQEHRNVFLPVIVSSSLAWASSEEFKSREAVFDRLTSQVIKSQYMDVFFQVALLVGGIDHAFAMQRKFRSYYPDPAPK